MKKILVIEDPGTCCDCPCFSCGEEAYCNVLLKPVYELKRIDCPLVPLPERCEIEPTDEEYMKHYKQGINDTIALIRGELMVAHSE